MVDLSKLTDEQLDLLEKHQKQGLQGLSDKELDDLDSLSKQFTPDTSASAYAKVAGASLPKGLTDLAGLVASGVSAWPGAIFGRDADYVFDKTGVKEPKPLDPNIVTEKVGEAVGGWPATDTPGKQMIDVGGRFMGGSPGGAPAAAGRVGRFVTNPLVYKALPGAASEYVRQSTEGTKFPNWVPGVGGKDVSPYAAAVTAMFAPKAVQKTITSRTVTNPVRERQYQTAVRESGGEFTPTAGQLMNDPAQINKEYAAVGEAFNQRQLDAAMRTSTEATGAPTTHVTYGQPGSWVHQNVARTGNNIDNLERRTRVTSPGNIVLPTGHTAYAYPDLVNIAANRPQDVRGILNTIENTSSRLVPHSTALPAEQIHSALFNSIGTGGLSGAEYRQLRSNLHRAAEGISNPQEAHSYRQVANVLDNAMARSSPRGQNWGQDWNQARREYANTLVFNELAAGAKKGRTQFTPDEIAAASKKVMGKEPWTRGELENAPFISAAQAFQPLKHTNLPKEPSTLHKMASYIPYGQSILDKGKYIGGALGTYGAYKAGLGPETMISAGILGAILGEPNQITKRLSPYAMTGPAQWRLKNQVLPPPRSSSPMMLRGMFGSQDRNNQ